MNKIKLILLTVVATLALTSSAQAVNLQGKYLQSCPLANIGQVDPMVSPGQVADHKHAEFGAKNWGASTTTADMLSGASTCVNVANHSAYWVPEMIAPDGTVVAPTSASGYYGAFGADPALIAGGKVYPYPQGLRFIVGNSKSTTLQSTSVVQWRCDEAGQPTRQTVPSSCPDGRGVELAFIGPKCWDGVSLDSSDHRSHMSNGTTGGGCDAAHPVRIPEIQWSFHYPGTIFSGGGGTIQPMLDSDHGIGPAGRTAHMDLWEAQDAMGQALLTQCVNDPLRNSSSSPLCGLFTYFGGTNGVAPNGWLANLNLWMGKNDYIAQSNGTPAT